MSKKNRFGSNKPKSSEMSLQITSMADIFTILLVFLLKSVAAAGPELPPVSKMILPSLKGMNDKPPEVLRIEISEAEILIDGKRIMNLNRFQIPTTDLEPNGASRTLSDGFKKFRVRQLASVPGVQKKSILEKLDKRLMVLLDQDTPYNTVKSALASAAIQGYTEFKLVVLRTEE